MNSNKKFTLWQVIAFVILAVGILVVALLPGDGSETTTSTTNINKSSQGSSVATDSFSYDDVPEWSGKEYCVINDNEPFFASSDYTTRSYEKYSPLDSLGRCGPAMASLGRDLMPTEKRSRISEIHPTGWHRDKYDFIEGELLYNRSHLIAYQLSAENANERNLITGTRYMNADGMEPFERMTGDYIRETGNHVLYRVTPVFVGKELVARGVLMEAESVEDRGRGIQFCIFCYNVQPGVHIDYKTGNNWLERSSTTRSAS